MILYNGIANHLLQMDDFEFSIDFNLANMTCQLVELGSFNPISTSWNVKFAMSRAWVSNGIVWIP